jgi:hypothetical protein
VHIRQTPAVAVRKPLLAHKNTSKRSKQAQADPDISARHFTAWERRVPKKEAAQETSVFG